MKVTTAIRYHTLLCTNLVPKIRDFQRIWLKSPFQICYRAKKPLCKLLVLPCDHTLLSVWLKFKVAAPLAQKKLLDNLSKGLEFQYFYWRHHFAHHWNTTAR